MNLREMIEVMEAAERGEPIETRRMGTDNWITTDKPDWNWAIQIYRVRRQPQIAYANIYRPDWPHEPCRYALHPTREAADRVSHDRIACIRIEYIEGQFDE